MDSQKEQSRVGEQIVDSKLGEKSVESVSMSEESSVEVACSWQI